MSIPQKSLSSLLSSCQKFSQLVEIWQSSDKKYVCTVFLRHGVQCTCIYHRRPSLVASWLSGSLSEVVLICLFSICFVFLLLPNKMCCCNVMIVRSGCREKATTLLLSAANTMPSCDITARLLPWLLATSQQDLPLMRMIVESELVRSTPLFHCMDEGTYHWLSTFSCHQLLAFHCFDAARCPLGQFPYICVR